MTANLDATQPPIADSLSTQHELELLRELQRLANERAQAEQQCQAALEEGLAQAEAERERATVEIERIFAESRASAVAEFEQRSSAARHEYEASRDAAQREYKGLRQVVEAEHSRVTEAARLEEQQVAWEAQTVFEAIKGRPKERFQEVCKRLERVSQELTVLEHDAATAMKLRRQWREFPPVAPREISASPSETATSGAATPSVNSQGQSTPSRGWKTLADPVEEAISRVDQACRQVREATESLVNQRLPRLFDGATPFGLLVAIAIASALLSLLLFGWQGWQWIASTAALTALVAAVSFAALWPRARRMSGEGYQAQRQHLADARAELEHALSEARRRAQREAHALVADRDQQIAAAQEKLHSLVDEKQRWKDSEIDRAGQTYPQRLAELRSVLDATLTELNRRHSMALSQATETRDARTAENRRNYEERHRAVMAEHAQAWEDLRQRWFTGLERLRSSWARLDEISARLFPDWESTDYNSWPRPTKPPTAIRFGQVRLDLANVKNGLSADERLRSGETQITLPALMTLDEHPALVITAEAEGRRQAVEVMQLAMLRFLTAMPPGKVRFTIFDAVGLGENFASFMHLADFDEQLIASRIWTDGKQIEEQLTRLTAHMETVLQKYLRNEFATITEYNERAGEVAEPFQVLVVANFPTAFSESAARKLVSIATSGPRCGVYTLVSVDRKQRLPNDFVLKDLLSGAVHLDWSAGEARSHSSCDEKSPCRFRWRYPAFQHMALTLDRPPSADRFNEVLRGAGRAAKDSMRVEVPFEVVAPRERKYWEESCASELVVPIGRAGAMRLQAVRLGKGTSQHLLVCGKTGSGKSSFLHALVTNTALRYSPDEVEFYLIDFKKGVEFKTYATHRLPHARVIAIESEREFGMSVLERLDSELRRRGDLFRSAGVQDLPDFRAARPDERMPRVLLVVDEFQELFVEDDKLSQEAALLLDRLVRQGRAFGIHVLLGSQTLSGAYSLARSTMGQMAVRVALQCSEADAHLILSDERNMAARFLSRPGEAIYNDQNGLLAGNSPFQVVWLPEAKRIEYLREIDALSKAGQALGTDSIARDGHTSRTALPNAALAPTIVFEGDQPADPADNIELGAALNGFHELSRRWLESSTAEGEVAGSSDDASAAAQTRLSASHFTSSQRAWLGAAVAIKPPTAATFARHAGSNLLVVGAWEESALGVLASAVVSLAAQNPLFARGERNSASLSFADDADPQSADRRSQSSAARFVILDGTRPESPEAGAWRRLADALPHTVTLAGVREAAGAISGISEELQAREAEARDDAPPIYLVIFSGGRFRDLRRSDDDFSFSMDADKKKSPDRQWAEILRNGPAWGIHTLLWCDSYNNVNRLLDRMMLREFEMRVAFQMSAADSSSLLDTPIASRLRPHRAYFASEDLGTLEKFRPYAPPTDAWLASVRERLANPNEMPTSVAE